VKPFERGRFEDLPERPRLPHDFDRTRGTNVTVRSRVFGEMSAHYRELGAADAPPLLLIHGLMTSSYSWRYVYGPLSKSWRVIAPDLPGAGRSDAPRATYTAAALAEWVGEFQRALSIEGCHAVGNSLGGYVCMLHAITEPKAFVKLVNVHSPASPDFKYRVLGALLSLPGTTSLLGALVGEDGRRWTHKNVHYWDESLKSLEEAEEYAKPLRTPEGLAAFRSYLKDAVSASGLARFGGALREKPFPIPLMLLYAKMDPLVSPKNGDYLAKVVPGATLQWIEDSSHFAHVDTPAAVVRAVEAFFGKEL
jgi:pimeloyl-ACP methyl ester carboxylesterase